MGSKFIDGVVSFVSALVNRRNTISQNGISATVLSVSDLQECYRHGIANKVFRLKAGMALKDTLSFASTDDETFYNRRLAAKVKEVTRWMLGFGRGIIVLHQEGDDLTTAYRQPDDPLKVKVSVFSGDMVVPLDVDLDLNSPRYYKPNAYTVRGVPIHWTRVVDFTYIKPPELLAPQYRYGGISESELIYEQLIADGIVQRSSPKIIEKASTIFYKVKGFKEAMRTGTEEQMVEYFSRMEDVRGLNSAGLIDAEDELEVVNQTISNLADADQITLRRLAMVTGLSITRLVGENAKGLNSSGDNEESMDRDMIEALQSDYLLEPINEVMRKLGQGEVWFKENQGETPNDRMDYETKAIANAEKLATMGEDHRGYLVEKDISKKDEFSTIFPDDEEDDPELISGEA